jgi:hypothetical protein
MSVKSPISGLFVALGITAIAASAAPAPPAHAPPKLTKWQQQQLEKFKNSAPADEYFGKMKLSYLGMNNTFRDAAISSGDHTIDPGIVNKVTFAEDALQAWARKYPRDPQLARTYFLATRVERKIWTIDTQQRAWINLNRLVKVFPASYFGKILAKDLAIGFTEHYYAVPVPCTTPLPGASDGAASLTAFPTPQPSPTEPPPPSATPSPMETTLVKGLHVEIIPQACVPPPTPSPSLLPAATASSVPAIVPAPVAPAPAVTSSP